MSKYISWHDPSGTIHVRDDVPDDAVCLDLGGWCPYNGVSWGSGTQTHFGRVLAIGSEHVVCSNGLHPVPARILMLTEDRTDYVIVEAELVELRNQSRGGGER